MSSTTYYTTFAVGSLLGLFEGGIDGLRVGSDVGFVVGLSVVKLGRRFVIHKLEISTRNVVSKTSKQLRYCYSNVQVVETHTSAVGSLLGFFEGDADGPSVGCIPKRIMRKNM